MEKIQLQAALEALLFAMGDAVETEMLASALEVPADQIRSVLDEMAEHFYTEERGIRLIRLDDSYQLCTAKEYFPCLIRLANSPKRIRLTDVMLETLSIIAYKQPVTKMEIEKIRGVKSDHAVNKLIECDLVAELGRLDAPGRPVLFGTTEAFLRHFGVSSVDELPKVDPLKKEGFKEEAEKEADKTLTSSPQG